MQFIVSQDVCRGRGVAMVICLENNTAIIIQLGGDILTYCNYWTMPFYHQCPRVSAKSQRLFWPWGIYSTNSNIKVFRNSFQLQSSLKRFHFNHTRVLLSHGDGDDKWQLLWFFNPNGGGNPFQLNTKHDHACYNYTSNTIQYVNATSKQ